MVAALERRTSPISLLMHLLRALYYVSAYFLFKGQAVHRSEKSDTIADALSRDNAKIAFYLCSQLELGFTPVPLNSLLQFYHQSTGTLTTGDRCSSLLFLWFCPSKKRVYQSGQSATYVFAIKCPWLLFESLSVPCLFASSLAD